MKKGNEIVVAGDFNLDLNTLEDLKFKTNPRRYTAKRSYHNR